MTLALTQSYYSQLSLLSYGKNNSSLHTSNFTLVQYYTRHLVKKTPNIFYNKIFLFHFCAHKTQTTSFLLSHSISLTTPSMHFTSDKCTQTSSSNHLISLAQSGQSFEDPLLPISSKTHQKISFYH